MAPGQDRTRGTLVRVARALTTWPFRPLQLHVFFLEWYISFLRVQTCIVSCLVRPLARHVVVFLWPFKYKVVVVWVGPKLGHRDINLKRSWQLLPEWLAVKVSVFKIPYLELWQQTFSWLRCVRPMDRETTCHWKMNRYLSHYIGTCYWYTNPYYQRVSFQ